MRRRSRGATLGSSDNSQGPPGPGRQPRRHDSRSPRQTSRNTRGAPRFRWSCGRRRKYCF